MIYWYLCPECGPVSVVGMTREPPAILTHPHCSKRMKKINAEKAATHSD